MSKERIKILTELPDSKLVFEKIFDTIDFPQGHILREKYLVDQMYITLIEEDKRNISYYSRYDRKYSAILRVVFAQELPLGTAHFEISSDNCSNIISHILTVVLPMYVQQTFDTFDLDTFVKYAPFVMKMPYFDIKEFCSSEDAIYLHYGIHDKFYCFVDYKFDFKSVSEVCRAGLYLDFKGSVQKILEDINIALPKYKNSEISFSTRYGKFQYKKIALILHKGIWKKTNANNEKIKQLISDDFNFIAPTNTKIGDRQFLTYHSTSVLETIIAKNDKCDLIQCDTYLIVDHPTKDCSTYVYDKTTFNIEYSNEGILEQKSYAGKYMKVIDKPKDIHVEPLVEFAEIEIYYQNDAYVTSHPEQIKLEVEDTILVDDYEVTKIYLHNIITKESSYGQNLIRIMGKVWRLDSTDPYVLKAGKYRKLLNTLSE